MGTGFLKFLSKGFQENPQDASCCSRVDFIGIRQENTSENPNRHLSASLGMPNTFKNLAFENLSLIESQWSIGSKSDLKMGFSILNHLGTSENFVHNLY